MVISQEVLMIMTYKIFRLMPVGNSTAGVCASIFLESFDTVDWVTVGHPVIKTWSNYHQMFFGQETSNT